MFEGNRWKWEKMETGQGTDLEMWKCGNVEMHAGKRCLRKRKDGTWNGENMEMETGNRWKFTCVPGTVDVEAMKEKEKENTTTFLGTFATLCMFLHYTVN